MPAPRIESISELRRICQDPVREFNDLTGSLYGWRLSTYITRLFLLLGFPAAVASTLMVVTGFAGSVLCLFGGWFIVAGLATLTLSYVLDCVDGEMARYQGIDSYRWAGVDYLHHMLVKGFSFLCLGLGLFRELGNPWTMAAGGACSVCWLLLMGVRDLPMLLFAKKIVMNERRDENPAYRRLRGYLDEIRQLAGVPTVASTHRDIWGKDFRFEPWMIRTFFTAFDVVVPLLAITALADRFLPAFPIFGQPFTITAAIVCLYAILLPLHLADSIDTAMRGKQVRNELYDLAGRIELKAPPEHENRAPDVKEHGSVEPAETKR